MSYSDKDDLRCCMLLIVIMFCFYLIDSYLTETANCMYTNMSRLCDSTTAGILYNMSIIMFRRQFSRLGCAVFGNFTIHTLTNYFDCISEHFHNDINLWQIDRQSMLGGGSVAAVPPPFRLGDLPSVGAKPSPSHPILV